MSIKVRVFRSESRGSEPPAEFQSSYFFASTSVGRPSRVELDVFLLGCEFDFHIEDYDAATGIGVAEIAWPNENSSNDLELSSCPDSASFTVTAIVNPSDPSFNLSASAFYDLLESHDWYFSFAEESTDYHSGLRDLVVIEHEARRGGDLFMSLLDEYRSYMFSGDRWGTAQFPKPGRPDGASYMDEMLSALTNPDRARSKKMLDEVHLGLPH